MNSLALTGRLVDDPVFRRTEDPGLVVTTARIRVPRFAHRRVTDLLELEAFQDVAEHTAHTMRAGSLVAIQGSVRVAGAGRRNVVVCTYAVLLGEPGPEVEEGCGLNVFTVHGRLAGGVATPGPEGTAAFRVLSRSFYGPADDVFDLIARGEVADRCRRFLDVETGVYVTGHFERDGAGGYRVRAIAVEALRDAPMAWCSA